MAHTRYVVGCFLLLLTAGGAQWMGRGISYNPGHGIGNGYGLGRAYGPRTGYEAFPDDRRQVPNVCPRGYCMNAGICQMNRHGTLGVTCSCPRGTQGSRCFKAEGILSIQAARRMGGVFSCSGGRNPCTPFKGGGDYHYPHPRIEMFVQCSNHGLQCYEKRCSPGLIFNPTTKNCERVNRHYRG